MEILEVRGDPHMRGTIHGEACREQIQDVVERVETNWSPALLGRLVEETGFVETANRHTPHLLDELHGIAAGSGVTFERILALNLMDETWLLGATGGEHCSSLGVLGAGSRPTIIAQNMDLPVYYDGAQTLLRIVSDDAADILVLTVAGTLGLCGCNAAGLGVVVNTILQLHSSSIGLPVVFVIRGLLEHASAPDAVAWCRHLPHASGQTYLVGDGASLTGLEASAHAVVEIEPDSHGILCHTNHALASTDRAWGADPTVDLALGYSGARLDALQAQLDGEPLPRVTEIERLLASRSGPLSRELGDPDSSFTFGSVVMELGGDPVMHVAAGPPSLVPFVTHGVRRLPA